MQEIVTSGCHGACSWGLQLRMIWSNLIRACESMKSMRCIMVASESECTQAAHVKHDVTSHGPGFPLHKPPFMPHLLAKTSTTFFILYTIHLMRSLFISISTISTCTPTLHLLLLQYLHNTFYIHRTALP